MARLPLTAIITKGTPNADGSIPIHVDVQNGNSVVIASGDMTSQPTDSIGLVIRFAKALAFGWMSNTIQVGDLPASASIVFNPQDLYTL